jgi:hypothetical protein
MKKDLSDILSFSRCDSRDANFCIRFIKTDLPRGVAASNPQRDFFEKAF